MYFQKVISRKTFFKLFFCWLLEGRWQKQDPDPNPDPDLLVRGMDLRIRIKTKIYWIRNTKSGSGRIDIILADPDRHRDRHPGHADPDPDPYPFQPKASRITPVLWIRIRVDPHQFAVNRVDVKRRIRIWVQGMRFCNTASMFPSLAMLSFQHFTGDLIRDPEVCEFWQRLFELLVQGIQITQIF